MTAVKRVCRKQRGEQNQKQNMTPFPNDNEQKKTSRHRDELTFSPTYLDLRKA